MVWPCKATRLLHEEKEGWKLRSQKLELLLWHRAPWAAAVASEFVREKGVKEKIVREGVFFKAIRVFQGGMRKCLQAPVGESSKYNLYNIGIAIYS